MLPKNDDRIIKVSGLSDADRQKINSYLIAKVNDWLKSNSGIWFAARDIFGGENGDWRGTDIQILYDRLIAKGQSSDEAYKQAAIDLGRLLKKALQNDLRKFNTRLGGRCRDTVVNKYGVCNSIGFFVL